MRELKTHEEGTSKLQPYLSMLGAWALAFGCAVGWGAFVMPGNTFLPLGGPWGSVLGFCLGGIAMLVLGLNYHNLMRRFPEAGGSYAYTRECFGPDQGFISAWFLVITYVAVIWANATALPLIARTLFGGLLQFGFHYVIAGFDVYMGEVLLCVFALLVAAFVCLYRRAAVRIQIVMAALLLFGIVIAFCASSGSLLAPAASPSFVPTDRPWEGVFTIFSLAPWAFVGFESISHSAAEVRFDLKHTFAVLAAAIVCATAAYALLTLMAVTAIPEGMASWTDYLANLGSYTGTMSQPTFFAAQSALGVPGVAILGVAALGGITTGLIGNYIALSRLLKALADDGMMPRRLGMLDRNHVPRTAILLIMAVSVILPFFGRTAISWIVDVTTVGATIAYAFVSAAATKISHTEGNKRHFVIGVMGLILSVMFAFEFLIPNLLAVKTLATESYLILAAWSILGFVCFRFILMRDTQRKMGRSIVAWVILLALVIFTSSVWMRQTTKAALDSSTETIVEHFESGEHDELATPETYGVEHDEYVAGALRHADHTLFVSIVIQVILIATALGFLFDIYYRMQERVRQTEVEKALAEESSRAKTSFLSNMSHEIRTPMNAIIGLDNIALRDPTISARTREHLEKIGASARHLLGLINDILDMSRIESGRMVLKNEEFSFSEFLDQINIIVNGQCQDKGLRYECVIVGNLSDYYVGDDMKLKQVLINILGNAVKFTDAPGDVRLTVEQIASFEGICTLRFVMSDTGVGMDEEFIPKIFEAFSQEDATTTNRYGGSGLGMAITKNFVDMMNGSLDVTSKKGVGTTFTLTVTLRASSRSASAEHGIILPADIKAIVVDDDEIACEHAQLVLRAIGIEADAVNDPLEGLRLIEEAHEQGADYRLVLTDYKMPSMNGLDLVRRIRTFDGGATSVIMLTGYNWDIIEDEARADGVDGILAKPLFSDSLTKEIHSILFFKYDADLAMADDEKEDAVMAEGDLAGRRVLMAEDVEQNAEILEDLLDLEEIEAERAVNGEVAVRMFEESDPGYYDVILMDVRMPVMDGLSATRAIRALDRPDAKTIPIIAMTANVFDEDVDNSLQAGMDAHLSKPVEPQHLYDTMARIIAQRSGLSS